MKNHRIGNILIAIGAVVIIYAFNMPVSIDNSGIVNIHMMSQRQNTLIFGGIIFLAGIILFAAYKQKQTKEDEIQAQEEFESLKLNTKDKLIIAQDLAGKFFNKITDANGVRSNPYKDRPVVRVISGVYTGICATLVLGTLFSNEVFRGTIFDYGFIFGLPLMLWLSFRKRSAQTVISRMNLVNIIIILLTIGALFIQDWFRGIAFNRYIINWFLCLIPISVILWAYAIKRIKTPDL
jgi:hypothetical protein